MSAITSERLYPRVEFSESFSLEGLCSVTLRSHNGITGPFVASVITGVSIPHHVSDVFLFPLQPVLLVFTLGECCHLKEKKTINWL